MFKKTLIIAVNLLLVTVLSQDIADTELGFVSFNLLEGSFQFVLLQAFAPGATWVFTTRGVNSDDTLSSADNEETVIWTTEELVPLGTVVNVSGTDISAGNLSGTGLSFESGGDQITVYKPGGSLPEYLAILYAQGISENPTSVTEFPANFTLLENVLVLPLVLGQHFVYVGLTTGDEVDIEDALFDSANFDALSEEAIFAGEFDINPEDEEESGDDDEGLSGGAIVGVAFACMIGIALVAALLLEGFKKPATPQTDDYAENIPEELVNTGTANPFFSGENE